MHLWKDSFWFDERKLTYSKITFYKFKALKRLIYLPKTIVDGLACQCIFRKKWHVTKNVWCTWSNWETILSSTWPFWMYFMITCQQVKQLSFNCNYISNEKLSNKCTSTLLLQNFVNMWEVNKYSKYILQTSNWTVLFGLEYVASLLSFVMF